MNKMDIWSSNDERTNEKVDVWEGEREWVVERVAAREEKGKEEKPAVKEEVKTEPEKEEVKKE